MLYLWGAVYPQPHVKDFTWFRVYDDRFGGFLRPKPVSLHYGKIEVCDYLVRQPGTYLVQSLP